MRFLKRLLLACLAGLLCLVVLGMIAGGVAWFSGDAGRIGRLRLAE